MNSLDFELKRPKVKIMSMVKHTEECISTDPR